MLIGLQQIFERRSRDVYENFCPSIQGNTSVKPFLPLTNDFLKKFFIDKIDEIMRGFHTCLNSEDISSIPDFSLSAIYLLAPVTFEHMFTFIKKMYKTFCRNNAIDKKTFDLERVKNS